jgi:hypothetical protein
MSHMVDSLAWTGNVPWHGLGRKLPQHATVDETALLDHNARNTSGGAMGRTLANGQSTIRNRAMELLQAA